MNTREWSSGYRHQTKGRRKQQQQQQQQQQQRRRRRRPTQPPGAARLKPLASSRSDPNLLLDPMLGPLLMARPHEAEFLISRNLEAGSPYGQMQTRGGSINNNSNSNNSHNKRTAGRKRGGKRKRRGSNHGVGSPSQRSSFRQRGGPSSAQASAHAAVAVSRVHGSNKITLKPLPTSSNSSGSTAAASRQLFAESRGGVTISNPVLNSNGNAEFRVVQAILQREHMLSELERLVSTSSLRPFFATDAFYLMLDLRAMAVNVIESIVEWRRPHARVYEFLWEGENYILKMFKDSAFLRVCRSLGLLMGLPGMWNNPLLEFDSAQVAVAARVFRSPVAHLLGDAAKQKPTLDYDPKKAAEEKKGAGEGNQHLRRIKTPVMLAHAKHCLQSELARLGLAHDRANGKLITVEALREQMAQKADAARRLRITERRKEFERLKRLQAERDRRGEEWDEEEAQRQDEGGATKSGSGSGSGSGPDSDSDQSSFAVRHKALLKCKDNVAVEVLEKEVAYLRQKLEEERQDVAALAKKTRRLELSLRSMTQEGLISQAMTKTDQKEASEAGKRYSSTGADGTSPNLLLDRLLTESSLQDFVGGWRLRKLREELAGAESRLAFLNDELALRKTDAKEQRAHVDHKKLMGEKKKRDKMRKRQVLLEARAARLAQNKKAALTVGGVANLARNNKKTNNEKQQERRTRRAVRKGNGGNEGEGEAEEEALGKNRRKPKGDLLANDTAALPVDEHGHGDGEALGSGGMLSRMAAAARKSEAIVDEDILTAGQEFPGPSFPHASAIEASRSSIGRPPRKAAALMMHGGCMRIGAGGTLVAVCNNGVFLSRRVIEDPALRRRSLVAQRAAEKEAERKRSEESQEGRAESLSIPSALASSGANSGDTKKRPPSKKSPSPLSKYAPYAAGGRPPRSHTLQEKQKDDDDDDDYDVLPGNAAAAGASGHSKDSTAKNKGRSSSASFKPNYLLLCVSHPCDFSRQLSILPPSAIGRGLIYSNSTVDELRAASRGGGNNRSSDGLIRLGGGASRPGSVDTMVTTETTGTSLTALVVASGGNDDGDGAHASSAGVATTTLNDTLVAKLGEISERHKMALLSFHSGASMPALVIAQALDVASLTRFCRMTSKATKESLGSLFGDRRASSNRRRVPWSVAAAQRQLGVLPLERRQLSYLKPVLDNAAVDAREALAFSRASTRALQTVDASDGDALFLAFARRDVCARRCIDALKLLGIVGGEGAGAAGGEDEKSGPTMSGSKSKATLKSKSSSSRRAQPQFNGIVSNWDGVVASVSSFDKKRIGKTVLSGLRPMVRQLRVDVERRLKSISHDMERSKQAAAAEGDAAGGGGGGGGDAEDAHASATKKKKKSADKELTDKDRERDEKFRAMRVAKTMGAWLGSLVGWHDKYYGKLESIERLSVEKNMIEAKLSESGVWEGRNL